MQRLSAASLLAFRGRCAIGACARQQAPLLGPSLCTSGAATSSHRALASNLAEQIHEAVAKARASSSAASSGGNARGKPPLANLSISSGKLDSTSFAALVQASVELDTPDFLETIAEFAQRQGPNVAAALVPDIARLIMRFPSMPHAALLVGMMTQRALTTLQDMPMDDLAPVFGVFSSAGPLGDHVTHASAQRIEAGLPTASATATNFVVDALKRHGPGAFPNLLPLLRARQVELLRSDDVPMHLKRGTLARALHPRFFAADIHSEAILSLLNDPAVLFADLAEDNAVVAAADEIAATVIQLQQGLVASECESICRAADAMLATVVTTRKLDACPGPLLHSLQAHHGILQPTTEAPGDSAAPSATLEAVASAEKARLDELLGYETAQRVRGDTLVHLMTATAFADPKGVQQIARLTDSWSETWDPREWAAIVEAVSSVGGASRDARDFIRKRTGNIAAMIGSSNGADLGRFARGIGKLQIRTMAYSTALSDRCVALRESMALGDITSVLVALTRVDARMPKAFLECVPQVRQQTSLATAEEAASLIYSYARHNIWLYKVYARLADRLADVEHELSAPHMRRALAGLQRVGVKHEAFIACAVKRAERDFDTLPFDDAVKLVNAISRAGGWSGKLFDRLYHALLERLSTITAEALGEALMCFARAGYAATDVCDKVALTAISLAPTAPPLAIADILTAYAALRVPNVELFAVYGERMLQLRQECPAVVIASVLTAFSTVGLKDDRLFIEMIPRVRFVAHHGTPQDVANVLTAYTSVGLWHYKLFVKLAERAIQVRAECSAEQMAQIMFAFAKVEMKYEKLFIDFSARVQTVAATAQPSQLAMISHSYAAVKAYDKGVLAAVAERAIATVGDFEEEEARMLLNAYGRLSSKNSQLFDAFTAKFPRLAESKQESEDQGPSGTPQDAPDAQPNSA